MSEENLIKLLEAAVADEQLLQQLESASSYEDVKKMARAQDLDLGDLSVDEFTRTVGVFTGQGSEELSDDDLEPVTGGFNIGMPPALTKKSLGRLAKGFSFGVERE